MYRPEKREGILTKLGFTKLTFSFEIGRVVIGELDRCRIRRGMEISMECSGGFHRGGPLVT